MPEPNLNRNPILAAGLSLVLPGLGQTYAGAWKRGLSLLVGLAAQTALFYGAGTPWLIPWIAVIWLWNAWDAFSIARGAKASAVGPVVLILALNLVAAWKITDIHIPKLGAEQRGVIGEIASGLGHPDFVARKTVTQVAHTKYYVVGPGPPVLVPYEPLTGKKPRILASPNTVTEGGRVTVTGFGFTPGARGTLRLLSAEEEELGRFVIDSKGGFRLTFTNTRSIPGDYFVEARVQTPARGWRISETLRDATPRMFETIYLALIGTAISLVFAIPLSFLGARNLMSGAAPLRAVYALTRALFSVLRSVEVLIIAVIAVAAVGIGPFAGVIALAIHGVGALGKLYSEAIESIEHGPIEAIRSTGASELQVIVYAVVPQVVPQFIAFTLYRWDINVRMATVIGLVGGGGIGYQLIQYMNLLQWRQAATAIWLIAGVVMLMDYASAVIRESIGLRQ